MIKMISNNSLGMMCLCGIFFFKSNNDLEKEYITYAYYQTVIILTFTSKIQINSNIPHVNQNVLIYVQYTMH